MDPRCRRIWLLAPLLLLLLLMPPPTFAASASPDVVGLRLGMTPGEVQRVLKEQHAEKLVSVRAVGVGPESDAAHEIRARRKDGMAGSHSDEIEIQFSAPPAPRVVRVKRVRAYPGNPLDPSLPKAEAVHASLLEKYGKPTSTKVLADDVTGFGKREFRWQLDPAEPSCAGDEDLSEARLIEKQRAGGYECSRILTVRTTEGLRLPNMPATIVNLAAILVDPDAYAESEYAVQELRRRHREAEQRGKIEAAPLPDL